MSGEIEPAYRRAHPAQRVFSVTNGFCGETCSVDQGLYLFWRPQGDSNPCYRRERVVS